MWCLSPRKARADQGLRGPGITLVVSWMYSLHKRVERRRCCFRSQHRWGGDRSLQAEDLQCWCNKTSHDYQDPIEQICLRLRTRSCLHYREWVQRSIAHHRISVRRMSQESPVVQCLSLLEAISNRSLRGSSVTPVVTCWKLWAVWSTYKRKSGQCWWRHERLCNLSL